MDEEGPWLPAARIAAWTGPTRARDDCAQQSLLLPPLPSRWGRHRRAVRGVRFRRSCAPRDQKGQRRNQYRPRADGHHASHLRFHRQSWMIRVMAAGTDPAAAERDISTSPETLRLPDRLRPLVPGAGSPRRDRQAASAWRTGHGRRLMPERLSGDLGARPGAKLGQDVPDVRLYGVARQEQLGGDVRVQPALCHRLGGSQSGPGSARPARPSAAAPASWTASSKRKTLQAAEARTAETPRSRSHLMSH